MRLLIRAKDRDSVTQTMRLMKESTDYNVVSSAIRALTNLVSDAPDLGDQIVVAVSEVAKTSAHSNIRSLAKESLESLR
jgi:hypothetical protein